MTTGEIMTTVVGATGIILTIVVMLWIYFEQQREKDRSQRRKAQHEEIKTMITHVQQMTVEQNGRLSDVIGSKLDGLSRRIDEQSRTLARHGDKIDHLDKAFGATDKRVALLEAQNRQTDENRRSAEKASS